MDQEKQKNYSNNVKSPVERKSKFTNCSFREYDKKREKLMCDNFEKEK